MQISLELKTKQQLALSPQLTQAIRLLLLSTAELQAEIQQVVEQNPLLEQEPPPNISHSLPSQTTSSLAIMDPASNYCQISQPINLREHLLSQLPSHLNTRDQFIALAIIDAIDIDGYLKCDPGEIIQSLHAIQIDVELPDVWPILAYLQNCEPLGIAARNLPECLLIQLERIEHDAKPLAQHIIEHYFEQLSQRQFAALAKKLQLSLTELQPALDLIKRLNPRPGAEFIDISDSYVTPDVFVKKENGHWQVMLNPTLKYTTPKINNEYYDILKNSSNETTKNYLRYQLQEAKWLINSVEARNSTLLKVATAIVQRQILFFERGELAMKSLRLQDIAQDIEMHESTVSRITTQKYIHTPHGIFELKYFFPSHIIAANGGSTSSTAIRAIIKKLITEEDSNKPYSDKSIVDLLMTQGIKIARRTITKYRKSLGIPTSTQRKR